MTRLITSVADIGSPIQTITAFRFKARTDLIALMTGAACVITDDQLVAGIGLFTAEPMDTEVVRVVKTASIPGVDTAMTKDLLRDRRRILAEIASNI